MVEVVLPDPPKKGSVAEFMGKAHAGASEWLDSPEGSALTATVVDGDANVA